MCRNMGICYGLRPVTARVKYPRFMLLQLSFLIFVQYNKQAIHTTMLTMTEPDKQKYHNIVGSMVRLYICSLYICCWKINCGVAITLSIFTRIITTDTPWLIHRGDTCGINSKFIIWLMFRVITPQQRHTFARPYGQYMGCPLWVQIRINVLHGVSLLSSKFDWYITSLKDPHSSHPIARL